MNERINTVIRRLLIIDYKMSIYFVQSQYGQYRSGNKSRSFDRLEGAKAHEYLRVHKGLSFITTVTNDPDGEAVFIEVPDKFRKEVISEKNHRHYVKASIKGSNIEAVSFQQLFSEKEELTYEDIIASPFANVEDIVSSWFSSFVKAHSDILPPISLHSLRHTNATLMIASGVPITTVSKRLGHADTTTTGRIYTHAIRSADEAASETLDNLLTPTLNRNAG